MIGLTGLILSVEVEWASYFDQVASEMEVFTNRRPSPEAKEGVRLLTPMKSRFGKKRKPENR